MNSQQEMLLKKFDEFKDKIGSQNKACQLIGVSSSVITGLKNGTYAGDSNKMFIRIADYFKIKQEAENTYTEVLYADTYISENIYSILKLCQIKGGLVAICGDAGIGKTKGCKQYFKNHSNNTVMITVNPCITSIKAILSTLADRIGAVQARSRDELWNNIKNKLNDGMLLIFDEAQHLTARTIDTLRSFSDYFADCDQTLGIAFIGNTEVASKFGSNCKKAEFAQIINRTKQSPIYCTNQIQREDIQKLFPILNDGGMEQETDLLLKIAQTKQGVRGTVNLFSNAYDNEDISYKGLVAMAKAMNLNV